MSPPFARRFALVATGAVLACAGVAAAQPANDLCAGAIELTSGVPAAGTTVGAAVNLTVSCVEDNADVWYVFTAPAAGPYQFSVSGTDNAALSLAVVTGCDFPIGISGCAVGTPEAGPTLQDQAFFDGQPMYLRVGSVGAGQAFTITAGPLPPPANDECAGATPLTLGVPVEANNLSATTSFELTSAEACASIAPGFAGAADVFFAFTPEFSGHYDFSTCDTYIDTILSVHSACPASPANLMACNDNAPLTRCGGGFGTSGSHVAGVELTAGVTYYLRVASVVPWDPFSGTFGEPGRSRFAVLVEAGSPVPTPANDTCLTAEAITPDGFVNGSTVNATGEPGLACLESDHFDVWYSFTAAAAERRVYEFIVGPTDAFSATATLSAYTGCGGQLITCQAYNPLTRPDMTLVLAVDPGQTVYLRIAGLPGTQDDFSIINLVGPPAASNDSCQTPAAIALNDTVTVDVSATPAGSEGACSSDDVYALWYAFTSPQDGYYRFAIDLVSGDETPTSLTLFGDCSSSPLACANRGDAASSNPNGAATAAFVGSGQTVLIRAARAYASRAPFTLGVAGPLPPPPPAPNDLCPDAVVISDMPFADQVNITLATADQPVCAFDGEPLVPSSGGIWYRYTPSVNRVFRGTVRSDTREGRVSVFTGACGSLTQIGCGEQTVPLTAGTTYHFLVSSSPGGHQGTNPDEVIPYGTTLEIDFIAPSVPPNDDCETAARITSSDESFTVNTLAADSDAPQPSCIGFAGALSDAVWYTFTTTTAGAVTIHGEQAPTAGGFYSPGGVLYTGSCAGLTEVACDSPAGGFFLTNNFTITTNLQAGTTYYLAVGSWRDPGGDEVAVTFTYTGEIDDTPACIADFNNSGMVTVQDIFDFLAAYFSADPRADVNGVGGVTVQDIFDFLAAYFSGCP